MTREIALHCMKSYSELHSDLCELCPIYGETGSDHCFEDALQYVIGMLEQEPTTKENLAVDAVSRVEVLKLMQDNWHTHNGDWAMEESMDDIRALPPVTPQEPKTGHWISHREHCEMNNLRPSGLGSYFWCSECDCGIDSKDFARVNYNYCPNCGSDNREVE